MANPYRELFRPSGTSSFFVAALVARFPLGMLTLGIVIMLSNKYGSFSLPGVIASTAIGANALVAPQLSRLADRYGQAVVALPATVFASLAYVLLISAAHFVWPGWTLFFSAVCIGFMPNFGAFSRARWASIYRGNPILRTAFALESIGEEISWMCGPIIVVLMANSFFPEAGMAATAVLFFTGALSFSLQRGTEPLPSPPSQDKNQPKEKPMILCPAVFFPSLTLFMLGSFFGVIEVTTTAFARQLDLEYLTFLPLSAYAIGSFITGVSYGALPWRLTLEQQLLVVSGLVVLTALPFLVIPDLWMLSLICFVSGLAYSPTAIIAVALIENLVEKERLTESMTWALISPIIGIACGISLSGGIVDLYGTGAAFAATILFGFIAFVIVLMAQKSLRTARLAVLGRGSSAEQG